MTETDNAATDIPPQQRQPPPRARRWRLIAYSTAVFLLCGLAWYGLAMAMAWTNTESFCISCHEMASTVYAEYRDSIHDRNAAGIRATCADCHVPTQTWPKLVKKIVAAKDVYHHLLGTIDTPEKFRDRREHMAQVVWAYMRSSDSRECRSCHSLQAMDLEAQNGRAARKHEKIPITGETCIDCHQGIAHALPGE